MTKAVTELGPGPWLPAVQTGKALGIQRRRRAHPQAKAAYLNLYVLSS